MTHLIFFSGFGTDEQPNESQHYLFVRPSIKPLDEQTTLASAMLQRRLFHSSPLKFIQVEVKKEN